MYMHTEHPCRAPKIKTRNRRKRQTDIGELRLRGIKRKTDLLPCEKIETLDILSFILFRPPTNASADFLSQTLSRFCVPSSHNSSFLLSSASSLADPIRLTPAPVIPILIPLILLLCLDPCSGGSRGKIRPSATSSLAIDIVPLPTQK